MAKLTIEEIIAAVKELTVLELNDPQQQAQQQQLAPQQAMQQLKRQNLTLN